MSPRYTIVLGNFAGYPGVYGEHAVNKTGGGFAIQEAAVAFAAHLLHDEEDPEASSLENAKALADAGYDVVGVYEGTITNIFAG